MRMASRARVLAWIVLWMWNDTAVVRYRFDTLSTQFRRSDVILGLRTHSLIVDSGMYLLLF